MSVSYGSIQLERAIEEYEKGIIKSLKRVIAETTEIIVEQAKLLAPEDTSNLRKSIDATYLQGGLTGYIRVGSSYGIYVNYGTGIYAVEGNGRKTPWTYWSPKLKRWVHTVGNKPQPFWEPAIELGAKHFESELKKLGVS